jgi:hypothetical protein
LLYAIADYGRQQFKGENKSSNMKNEIEINEIREKLEKFRKEKK